MNRFAGILSAFVLLFGATHSPAAAQGKTLTVFAAASMKNALDDIDADLRTSAAVIPDLPASSRRAVALAQGLFAELSVRLRRTPASELVRARVRVPDAVKLRIAAGVLAGRIPSPRPAATVTA